jgi:ADP-heptose:LPS heptosyltransferase
VGGGEDLTIGMGDELMVTGHVREMQLRDPRKVRLDYGKKLWNAVFDHNPRIARPDENGDFQIYHPRSNGLRPYAAAKSTDRWVWREYQPLAGELYLQPDEIAFAEQFTPDVVIEPTLKSGASPNKQWGRERWRVLIMLMRAAGIRAVQMGPMGTPRASGVEFIETRSFRLACAVLKRARAAVLHEGGMHHAAAAVGVRAVVLYGGFISPAQTGYSLHTNVFTGRKPCGMRIACNHCAAAMAQITPQVVLAELAKLLAKEPV